MENLMATQTANDLRQASCKPCEGGVEKMSPEEAAGQLTALDGWELDDSTSTIARTWKRKDFQDALDFVNRIGKIAEADQHHPDLHLVGYRNVRVALTTHAIGGLSENDFILAAKIDHVA